MAAATEVNASKEPLRLDLTDVQTGPNLPSEDDGSSPDEVGRSRELQEEDVHAVFGPSISRAQTRMMSPQTPAVEKTAAMAEMSQDALFDGILEERESNQCYAEPQTTAVPSDGEGLDTSRSSDTGKSTPHQRDGSPRKGSRTPPEHREPGATGMLADMNVRRYMASFSLPKLPSLPKSIQVPTLSSVLGGSRSQSPSLRESRQKRANTLKERPILNDRYFNSEIPRPSGRPRSQSQTAEEHQQGGERVEGLPSSSARRPPYLRRATSDQSLYLNRALSAVPSLGDDSRWENVQEQVNSRLKALKDSFQDSSIKLPSMPNMPSVNLNPFRVDSTKSRSSPGSSVAEGKTESEAGVNVVQAYQQNNVPTAGDNWPRKLSKPDVTHLDRALNRLTGDLVVLGGYRGSILRSAKPPHRQVWVPVKVGLNIRKVNLEVGLEPEDEENMEKTIFPSGMLSHIGPVDMGRRLLKKLQTCNNCASGKLRVHDYGYDWRLSPHLSSRKLIEYLENLPCNQRNVPQGQKGVVVLAHSMGGLITRHAVNQRPDLFAGVLYAGVPQHCVNILGPFRNGDDVLLSSKVLTAQVNFTMRSSFVLLPDNGVCFVDKESKEEYMVDFFDPKTWEEHALSPCIAPIRPPVVSSERKSLLGSISDSLPSLPSLPLPIRKLSLSQDPSTASSQNTGSSTAHKMANLTDPDPSTARALDPSFSTSTISASASNVTIPYSQAYSYLTRTLRQTLEFRQQLHHKKSHQAENRYPPHSIIYATNTPTVCRARVTSRAAIACADAYDDLQFASGDGVVLARAAQLPEGYRVARGGRIKTERGHVGLLGDLEAVGQCINALLNERKKGVGLGSEARKC